MNYYFITGTSSGIGKALVEELLQFSENKIVGLSRTNSLTNKQFEHFNIDLSDAEATSNFDFQKLNNVNKIVLINNAGTLGEIQHIGQQDYKNIQSAMQVNFTSAAILINQFIKQYQDTTCEKIIINISSGAATSAYDGWANYCSAKAALNMFTQVINKEQESKDFPIKTFAIAPGVVDTIMQDTIRATSSKQFSNIDKFVNLKKNDQLYKAEDVAEKLVEMINHTDLIGGVVSRISL